MKNYMLDTNIFDHIKKRNTDISNFGKANFFITHIQHDEILATKDPKMREELNHVFKNIIKINLPTESLLLGTSNLGEAKLCENSILNTESAVYDISKYGKAKYTHENNMADFIKSALDKKKKHRNNHKDALIAETAIKNNLILVTDDQDLFEVVTDGCGGVAQDLPQLLAGLELN